MFARDGHHVTGLDTQYVARGPLKYLQQARHDGLQVAMKSAVRDTLFTGGFRRILDEAAQSPAEDLKVVFVRSTAESLPLPDNAFDLVFSYCAFEHIPDVEKAAAECARVLKPEGLAHITYHLFTSISGSHHNRWFYPDTDPPRDVPPWFHLRESAGGVAFPAMDYGVNALRLSEYREIFARHFDVVEEYDDKQEGAQFLTQEIREELSAYTEEELINAFKTVLARPKQ
jgi:ubiquinone/menaquinone biosynthesis C-methylase UbiE